MASYAGLTSALPDPNRSRADERDHRLASVFFYRQRPGALIRREQLSERRPGHRHGRRGQRKFLEPDRRELRLNWRGAIAEQRVVNRERQGQDRQCGGPDHPPRHVANQAVAPILEPLPAERQLLAARAAMAADLPMQILAHLREALVATVDHLVLAGEAERQVEVLQLHQVDVACRGRSRSDRASRRIFRRPTPRGETRRAAGAAPIRFARPTASRARLRPGWRRARSARPARPRSSGRTRARFPRRPGFRRRCSAEGRPRPSAEVRSTHLPREQQQRTGGLDQRIETDAEVTTRRRPTAVRRRCPTGGATARIRVASGDPRRPPPGRGRSIVGSGVANGSSRSGTGRTRVAANRPEFHRQARELARDVHGHPP